MIYLDCLKWKHFGTKVYLEVLLSMKKSLSVLLALILCFVLVGSFAFHAVAEEEETYVEEYDEDAEGEEGTIDYDIDYIYANLDIAYGGVMANGEYVGFGANNEGSFAMMFFFTPEQHITFVGPAVVDGNAVSIQDDVNGLTITFIAEGTEEGEVLIDIGEYGQGVIGQITADELLNAFVQVLENTFTTDSVE